MESLWPSRSRGACGWRAEGRGAFSVELTLGGTLPRLSSRMWLATEQGLCVSSLNWPLIRTHPDWSPALSPRLPPESPFKTPGQPSLRLTLPPTPRPQQVTPCLPWTPGSGPHPCGPHGRGLSGGPLLCVRGRLWVSYSCQFYCRPDSVSRRII